ncbi:MAG: hypothetical protein WB622_14240 [Acidobacteriaceae bacterium]
MPLPTFTRKSALLYLFAVVVVLATLFFVWHYLTHTTPRVSVPLRRG